MVENVFRKLAEVFGVPYGGPRPYRLEDEVLSPASREVWASAASRHNRGIPIGDSSKHFSKVLVLYWFLII